MANKIDLSALQPTERQGLLDKNQKQYSPTKEVKINTLPWEKPEVSERVIKQYLLRLPEPLKLKLEYVARLKNKTIQQYCLKVLSKSIEYDLKKIVRLNGIVNLI